MARRLGNFIRSEAIRRAENRCQACGWVAPDPTFLDIHHMLPFGLGGDDADDNLVCLCPTCHRIADWLTRGRPRRWDSTTQLLERVAVIWEKGELACVDLDEQAS